MVTGLMGGRAAEETVFGDITSGAASDLREATRIARLMVCNWGMSKKLGPQTFGEQQELMFLGREVSRTQDYSEDTAQKIDAEVNGLLRECFERASQILRTYREKLDMIAGLLLERETLDGRDVEDIAAHGRILSQEERQEEDKQKKGESSDAAAAEPPADAKEPETEGTGEDAETVMPPQPPAEPDGSSEDRAGTPVAQA